MRFASEPISPDPALIAFGVLVRHCRQMAWLSQYEFGRLVGLDQGSVSRLEHGRLRGIRLYRLAPVLKAIGVVRPGRAIPLPQGQAPPVEPGQPRPPNE